MTTFLDASHPETRAELREAEEAKAVDIPPEVTAQGEKLMTSGARARMVLARVPGDKVNQATANLPDKQRSAIRWFHAHGSELDLSNEALAGKIGYTGGALSMIFNGKYESSLDRVTEEIERYKKLYELRAVSRKLPFISTKLSKSIWQVCDAAREMQRIGFIYGNSQVGKTTALESYTEAHNHGSTVYVRMPAGGAMSCFISELARCLRISDRFNLRDMRARIIPAFDDRMLLIVDECHLSVYGKGMANHPLDFVREIHDRSKCGMVLCGTKAFKQEIETGKLAQMMKQILRRRVLTLQLPDCPTREDLNTFASAYGLSPASGAASKLETMMVEREALGMWLTLLRCAAKIASKKKETITWDHVIAAHRQIQAMEGAFDAA